MKRLAKIYDEKIGTVQVSLNDDLENEYLLKQAFEPMDIDERPFNGIYYLQGMRPADPLPTHDEISKLRERAYTLEVDQITCHINRLKDEEQTPEIIAEIEALMQERAEKVQDIKERYPYPDEEK